MTLRVQALPWDDGIRWMTERIVAPTDLPLTVAFVRDEVLRVANGTAEDAYIEQLIRAATDQAEHDTDMALMTQRWRLTLSGFPSGPIVLPRPPFVSVESFTYVDSAGEAQTLAGSPAEYQVKPSGRWSRAELWPLENLTWPGTAAVSEAVVVDINCGYTSATTMPAEIAVGMQLLITELYKQRSLSVHAVHNTPSVLQLSRFWKMVP